MKRGRDEFVPLAGKSLFARHVVHGHSSGLGHDVIRIVHVWWLVAVRRAVDAVRVYEVTFPCNRIWSHRPRRGNHRGRSLCNGRHDLLVLRVIRTALHLLEVV